jgi:hypothetical protein
MKMQRATPKTLQNVASALQEPNGQMTRCDKKSVSSLTLVPRRESIQGPERMFHETFCPPGVSKCFTGHDGEEKPGCWTPIMTALE